MKSVFAAVLALSLGAAALPVMAEDASPTPSSASGMSMSGVSIDQKGQIEKIVHDYLLAHPEVIRDAMIALQSKEEAQKADDQSQAVAANKDKLYRDPATPVAGNPIGDVTLVEFFDYHCPYCKAVAEPLAQLLKDDKGVRLVLKEFPILGEDSKLASKAALAAVAQGKYWEFHQALLAHRGTFDVDTIKTIAKNVGLNPEKLVADMGDAKVEPLIDSNRKLADSLDLSATPTFIIGGEVVEGAIPLDQIKALIKKARGS
jgi:protein-disulfide isomerase